MQTHYDVLGIEPDANDETISSAFRMLAKCWHPDLNAGDDWSVKQFKQVTAAYVTLRNSVSRAAYDESLVVAHRHRVEERTRKFIYCAIAAVVSSLVSGGISYFRPQQAAAVAGASLTPEQQWRLRPPEQQIPRQIDAAAPAAPGYHDDALLPTAAPPDIADAAPVKEAAVITTTPLQHPPPELIVGPVLDVEAAAATRFSVRVSRRPEDLPPGTYVRVEGLPGGVTLSGGQSNAERAWVVPLRALQDLKIKVPPGVSGSHELRVALVDNNGAILAQRSAALGVKPIMAAVPSAVEAVPAPRKEAVTTSAMPPADAATATRGQHPIRRTAPGSNVDVSGPSPLRHWEREGAATDVPYQNECLTDSRVPCNIGGGNGWWLGRALGDITRRGRPGSGE